METNPLIIILFLVTLLWLGGLTFFLVKIFKQLTEFNKGIKQINFDLNKDIVSDINKKLRYLEGRELTHIQKVGMIRFNPFNETGGDNSFAISLLDGEANGIVITGLHSRDKTRIYAKKIEKGQSKFELSKEEQAAISLGIRQR